MCYGDRTDKLIPQFVGLIDLDGHVDVTDPCYDRKVSHRMNHVPVMKGVYVAIVWGKKRTYKPFKDMDVTQEFFDNHKFGIYKTGEHGIFVYDETDPAGYAHAIEELEFGWVGDISVDSGLAGFFKEKPDYTQKEWNVICAMVENRSYGSTVDGHFVQTLYGDGVYDVYAAYDEEDNDIIALEIRF